MWGRSHGPCCLAGNSESGSPQASGVSVVSQSPAAEVNTVTWKPTEKVQTPVCRLGPVQGFSLHLVSSKGSDGMRTTPSWALAPLPRSSQSPLGHMAVRASSSSETWRCSGTFENEKIKFMSHYPALKGKKLAQDLCLKPKWTFWMSMARQVKVLAANADNPSLSPRTHVVEAENQLPQIVL